jgi:hypothetical protein
MFRLRWVVASAMILGLGYTPLANSRGQDDLTPQQRQKKLLAAFQNRLESPPINPNLADEHLQKVRADFRNYLSVHNRPDKVSTDNLAATFVRGVNDGQISTSQAVHLSKELGKVLDLPQITISDTRRFVASIEPLVRQTGTSGPERLRLYRELIRIVHTAPTYAPDQR